jgi:hypothetical protein
MSEKTQVGLICPHCQGRIELVAYASRVRRTRSVPRETDIDRDEPYTLPVARWMRGKRDFRLDEVFTQALGIPWREVDRPLMLRVTGLLRQLGARQTTVREGKQVVRVWRRLLDFDGQRLGIGAIEDERVQESGAAPQGAADADTA